MISGDVMYRAAADQRWLQSVVRSSPAAHLSSASAAAGAAAAARW